MANSIYNRRLTIGRHGVTLMEVLISIAVVAIGLLGVVALIPVGGQQAQTGARNDRQARLGRRTFREFKIRGMNSVNDNWLVWSPSLAPPQFAPPLTPPYSFDFAPVGAPDGIFNVDDLIANPVSVLINPLGLRLAEPQGALADAAVLRDGYDPANTDKWFMPRVVTSNLPVATPTGIYIGLGPACEEVFIGQDDLVFEEPDDNAAPPLQTMLTTVDGTGTPVLGKRYAEGRYSWFATLVPLDPIGKTSGNSYRLATAIVAERNTLQPTEVIEVDPITFPNVVFATASPNLRVGHWIMLAAKTPGSALGEGNYGWYRIIRKNDNVLTLSGMLIPAPAPPVNVYAIVIPNVVNVYTKTIRLEP